MVSIRGYISSNFSKSFLTIFIPVFLIISLIYFVRLSMLTAQIKLSISELLLFYSYFIPEVVFFTMPLSFVVALANLLTRLSTDNELIALYALGFGAKKVIRSLLLVGSLFSLFLFTISFLAMPLTYQLSKAMMVTKAAELKPNITEETLGQKFGNYYIYAKKSHDDVFDDIVIYNHGDTKEEQFFSSKFATLKDINGTVSLRLNEGYGYTYDKDNLKQIKYSALQVYMPPKSSYYEFKTVLEYWTDEANKKKALYNIYLILFVSLMPLISIPAIAAFTMINPRYQNTHSYIVTFVITLVLYFFASILQKWATPLLLFMFTFFVVYLGYFLFKKRVLRYF